MMGIPARKFDEGSRDEVDLATMLGLIRECMRAEGVVASNGVELTLETTVLDEDGCEEAMRVGLISLVNDLEHKDRTRAIEGRSERREDRTNLPAKARVARLGFLSQYFAAADKTFKPLLRFQREDWLALAAECKAQAAGYAKKRKVAEEGAALLEKHKATTMADVPKAAREAFEVVVEQAWRG